MKVRLGPICATTMVGLDVAPGRATTRRTFTVAEYKRALSSSPYIMPVERKQAGVLLERLRARKVIQGPKQGPFALTERGWKVAARACHLWARKAR